VLALRSPELDVRAITTVCGNVEVSQCTQNAYTVLEKFGRAPFVSVAQGAARPLQRRLVTATEVHGRDGLGNVGRPGRHRVQPVGRSATELILEMCRSFGRKLTIIALGPLTNLARAWKSDPRMLKRVGRVITMGGAFNVPGNTGPVAEFNYFVDPEAAHIILHSGLPILVIPLDVTQQVVLMRSEVLDHAERSGAASHRFLERMTRFYFRYHVAAEGFDGGYMHDPVAVGCAADPGLVRTREMVVDVERKGEFTRGMTVADLRQRRDSSRGGVQVATHIDRERFLRMFHDRVWAERQEAV